MAKKFEDLVHKKDGLTNWERKYLLKLPHETSGWNEAGNPVCVKECPRCKARLMLLAERAFQAGSIDNPDPTTDAVVEFFKVLRDERDRAYREGFKEGKEVSSYKIRKKKR